MVSIQELKTEFGEDIRVKLLQLPVPRGAATKIVGQDDSWMQVPDDERPFAALSEWAGWTVTGE
jgi:hypothetical protein